MPGYWHAHSDRDWEDRCAEPPSEAEWQEMEIDRLAAEVRNLKATVARMRLDLVAATKWVRSYEDQHGAFENDPPMPDFMIPF